MKIADIIYLHKMGYSKAEIDELRKGEKPAAPAASPPAADQAEPETPQSIAAAAESVTVDVLGKMPETVGGTQDPQQLYNALVKLTEVLQESNRAGAEQKPQQADTVESILQGIVSHDVPKKDD